MAGEQYEIYESGTAAALAEAQLALLGSKADKTGTYSTLTAGGTTPNSVTDAMLAQTGGVLSEVEDIIDTLSIPYKLESGTDYTIQSGYYGSGGAFVARSDYNACVIPYDEYASEIVVTTAATSAARIAVFFSGEPSTSTCIGNQNANYPDNYGVAQFENFELTIPNGTEYIAINRSLVNGPQKFEVTKTDIDGAIHRLSALEKEISKVDEALSYNMTLENGVDYTFVSGTYYNKDGIVSQHVNYGSLLLEYDKDSTYTVTTYANSVAPIAVYYSDTPSTSTFIGIENANYLPSYEVAKYSDVVLSIPPNTKYIAINCHYTGSPTVKQDNINQRFERIERKLFSDESYRGKKILYIGDSITALGTSERGWPGIFQSIVQGALYVNVAVIGARWCDYSDTVLDGNPVFGGPDDNHNNTISNQVEKIVRGKDESDPNYSKVDEYEDFDAIIIAAGTNDVNTDDGLDTQFVVGGIPVMLDDLDRMTWGGAMRYAYERLRDLYPDAAFFYCSPIQGAETIRPYSVITEKRERMRDVCDRISDVTFVDTFNCGVCGVYELANTEGRDLIDGLHPLATGAMKIAKYNANAFINFYNFDRG